MQQKSIHLLLTVLFSSLLGCQQFPGGNFFNLASRDDQITTAVKLVIEKSNKFTDNPVQVETENGVVYLSGYVKTIRQSDLATELTSKTVGVLAVENNLIVRSSSHRL